MNQDVLEDRLREHYRRRTQHLNTQRPEPTTIRAYADTATPETAFRPRRMLAIAAALLVMAGIGMTLRDTSDPAPSTGSMVAVTTTTHADEPLGGHDTETIQVSGAADPATGVARIVEVNRAEFMQGQADLATRLALSDRDHYYQYGAMVEGDKTIAVATVKCAKNEAAMFALPKMDPNDPKSVENRPVPVCEQLDPPIRLTDLG